ncbi:heterokaryon incompatibility protein-domain-containing protein [Xylariales sp. AK1849]|nr:heterokaryon incompatibility protein-domain-containing protein [Xylariales sp. AK1849]
MFKAAGQSQGSETGVLRRFSTRRVPKWGWQSIDVVALSAGSPFLVPQPRGVRHVRILGRQLSIGVVKEWMSVCSEWYTKSCNPKDFSRPESSIMSFKLINCDTRQIISRTDSQGIDHSYVALSYLWGQRTEKSRFLKVLPSTLPQTIEDALKVTKQLGYQYIWIDRFCINQESNEEKQEQFPTWI